MTTTYRRVPSACACEGVRCWVLDVGCRYSSIDSILGKTATPRNKGADKYHTLHREKGGQTLYAVPIRDASKQGRKQGRKQAIGRRSQRPATPSLPATQFTLSPPATQLAQHEKRTHTLLIVQHTHNRVIKIVHLATHTKGAQAHPDTHTNRGVIRRTSRPTSMLALTSIFLEVA